MVARPNANTLADSDVPERADEGISLREHVGLFIDNWWILAVCAVLGLLIGAYNAWTLPAVYTANALIQVEQPKSSSGSPGFSINPFASSISRNGAQEQILKSRSVAARAVQQLDLTLQASPDRFPSFGDAWARGQPAGKPASPPLPFLEHYAWGGEILTLDRLTIPASLVGTPFQLVAQSNGGYQLRSTQGRPILTGRVGKAAQGRYRGNNISLFVSKLVARPGTYFTVRKRGVPQVVGALAGALQVSQQGYSGILNVNLSAGSPQAAQTRLNALAQAFLRQNVERQSEEAKRTLTFLRGQLPQQNKQVQDAQAKLRDYQTEKGTVDLTAETQALLTQSTNLEEKVSQLKLQKAELLQTYTKDSPQYRALQVKRQRLNQERAKIQAKLKKLPDRESKYLELERDAKVANDLYVQLLDRTQELKVAKAGVTGFVRIVDSAYASHSPTGPHRSLITLAALLIGLLAGAGIILLRGALTLKLKDPSAIENKLGVPVYATVPLSRYEQRLSSRRRGGPDTGNTLLAQQRPHDTAIESLRSLRTSLQFAFLESSTNILAIGSSTPSCGKSFVSSNLAYLLAEAGQRVLLIDADMRLGHLHKQFGLPFTPGLSTVIVGESSMEEAIKPVFDGKMDFLSSGVFPPNPSELLLHPAFRELLRQAGQTYDVVVLDTPPLLNVTDGVIIAKEAGTTFLVARGEHSTLHEVESGSQRLQQNNIRLSGVVFNGLRLGASRYGYGNYRYYGYEYKAAKS